MFQSSDMYLIKKAYLQAIAGKRNALVMQERFVFFSSSADAAGSD